MGSPYPVRPVSRTLSLARRDRPVLGATLNRSESRCWACPREPSRLIAFDELRIVLGLIPADLDQNGRLEVQAGASRAAAHLRASTRSRDRWMFS